MNHPGYDRPAFPPGHEVFDKPDPACYVCKGDGIPMTDEDPPICEECAETRDAADEEMAQ